MSLVLIKQRGRDNTLGQEQWFDLNHGNKQMLLTTKTSGHNKVC